MLLEISEIVEKARESNYLFELNEYLRQIVMGPHGDTKFDEEFIKNQHKKNMHWRKKSTKKNMFKK